MLSFKRGVPIAVICGGDLNERIVRLNTGTDIKEEPETDETDYTELIEHFKSLSARERRALRDELMREAEEYGEGDDDDEPRRYQPCRCRASKLTDRKEIVLSPVERMQIIPSCDSERVFIAGKSGSGKSTLAALYMYEYLRMFPKRRIFLVSRHDNEKAYQNIPHTALPLTLFQKPEKPKKDAPEEEYVPIELEELRDSLIVFDDCDNLQDKWQDLGVRKLNDDIISNGRKYNIHCVTLAHQIMNWQKTRNLLLEANKIIFFPAGAAKHIRTFLTTYGGLEPDAVKKIMALASKSRWVMLGNIVPQYIVHEHGAYVL